MSSGRPSPRNPSPDFMSFVRAAVETLTPNTDALWGELCVERALANPTLQFVVPEVRGTGKRAVWTGLHELEHSLVSLNTTQVSTVETVVTAWNTNGFSPDPVAPPIVVDDLTAWLNGQLVIASTPAISAETLTADWYRHWLYWTTRAISHGVSTEEILQAIRRRKAALRAARPLRSVRVLQRVMTELQRVHQVLRPHAPPALARPQQTAEGLGTA